MKQIGVVFVTLLALSNPLAAMAGQSAAAVPASKTTTGYVLGPGDVIEVTLVENPDFKTRATIEADGTVVLPMIGRVTAMNLAVMGLREEVRKRLVSGGFYRSPEVSVLLITTANRFVTILGEVTTPGVIALDHDYHLSELIARAGGTKSAAIDLVTLTTPDGQSKEYSLSALATGAGQNDPIVNAGDKVFAAPARTFYIYGQVSQPGTYPIDPGLTVRRALARGGGLTALGSEKKVKVFRGEHELKPSLDEKILPGDTVVVGERFF